jgi:hypothetical protein
LALRGDVGGDVPSSCSESRFFAKPNFTPRSARTQNLSESAEVIDKLKENGYRWQPANRIWTHAYGDRPMSVRIEGERLYQEIRQMIRQEKGIEAGQEIPF